MHLHGIHHVTAVSARIRENYQFYTNIMGMRLVKRSVNQDDVSAYHLFYSGDKNGAPGNDLTFFDWDVPRERSGTRSITRTSLRVASLSALTWWKEWLDEHCVTHSSIQELDQRATILFEDPEGMRLALVVDGGIGESHTSWDHSPVPASKQIRGQGPIWLSVPELRRTDLLLTTVLQMRQVRQYTHPEQANDSVYVYEMGQGGAHAELHIAVQPSLPPAQQGAGAVHHVAFRTKASEYHEWTQRLQDFHIQNSGEVDRYWFQSLYFREPTGILFEIATDEPGFTVDEDSDTLGEKVVLPPFLEPQRDRIVANLKPLT